MSKDAIVCHNFSIAQGTFGMENINMQIKRGYITGLIGRNGSGKTTLIKGIAGILNAANANVVIENLEYSKNEVVLPTIEEIMCHALKEKEV